MINPIFDIENWKEIFATLSRNKTRTFLTAFGIFWGVAMLGMLLGGARGLESIMRNQFAGFATNSAFIVSNTTGLPYKGFKKGNRWSLTTQDIEGISHIDGVDIVSAMSSRYGLPALYQQNSTSVSLIGATPEYSAINEPIIYSGRFINATDEASSRKICVIGQKVAATLFGTESPISHNISLNGIYYKVVGVCGDKSEIHINGRLDESVCIPLSTMQQAYNTGNKVDIIIMSAMNGVRFSTIQPQIERAIRSNHPIHPDDKKAIWFLDISEQFEIIENLFLGISLLAGFVGAGTLLAGIIGVGNIMWVIVKERTQEIGIRRAIGAKPRDITIQILSESVALTFIAGLLGISFAVGVLYIVESLLEAGAFQLGFAQALVITMAFVILGTAAGIIPAIKAMRIKPIEAINDK
jgi:putative ABC transport system permease protein